MHRFSVEYTNDDDGIWVVCSCRWRSQVAGAAFCPEPQALVDLANGHLREVGSA